MDYLDRTNVVQSIFGRYILFRQLQDRIEKQQNIGKNARNLPTGASKAFQRLNLKLPYFTRTGIRTKQGILDDGINSLQRYYLNNFHDAERQEAIDLIVGNAYCSAYANRFKGILRHDQYCLQPLLARK